MNVIPTEVLDVYILEPKVFGDHRGWFMAVSYTHLDVYKRQVHELSMMMTIALRFIPTLIEETDKLMSAQKARGADLESGGIMQRARALVPILIPLFVSAFRRADELALARCV